MTLEVLGFRVVPFFTGDFLADATGVLLFFVSLRFRKDLTRKVAWLQSNEIRSVFCQLLEEHT